MERRDLLRLLGIASASAACDLGQRDAKLIPLLLPPADGVIPGEALFFHSTCTECPSGCGLLVKVMDGRPVKLEGHPEHPLNHGALCLRGQASLERLYSPRRLRAPARRESDGAIVEIGWATAFTEIRTAIDKARRAEKKNLFVSGATTGRLAALIDEFCDKLGFERLPEIEIFHHGAIRRANEAVFGRAVVPDYRIDEADLLISIGVDYLETWLSPVTFGRRFASLRDKGGRSIHVEPHLSLTGLASDLRLTITAGAEIALLAYLLRATAAIQRLPSMVASAIPDATVEDTVRATGLSRPQLEAIAGALRAARRPLLIAGGVATAHAGGATTATLAALLQRAFAMESTTLDFDRCWNLDRVGDLEDVRKLTQRLETGEAGVILLSRLPVVEQCGGLLKALGKAETVVTLTDFTKTAPQSSRYFLPCSHSLESAGDAEARHGLRSIVRPLIRPLHNTHVEGDVLLGIMGQSREYARDLREQRAGDSEALEKRGFVETDSDTRTAFPAIDAQTVTAFLMSLGRTGFVSENALVIVPSLRTYDGRSRVLELTQEIPDPLAAVTYGRWLSISESEARQRSLKDQDEVAIKTSAGDLTLPVRIQPGLPPSSMMLSIDAAAGLTLSADPLTGEARLTLLDVTLTPTGRRRPIPILSGSMTMEPEREPHILDHDAQEKHGHGRARDARYERPSLDPPHEHREYRWGMAVDLDRCTGCSACVAACYVENNLALTGPEEHLRGRELSWLRIQPYSHDGHLVLQPRMCQHCERAPCEPVCPVHATYHNPEGLNVMVYNRCVGTRYCSNNCPYKVRRFNWFEYEREAPFDLMINPEVSQRPRGVMEKCTFCVQRIRKAKDRARDVGRAVRDGEVVPACAQACPTGALTFGNVKDERSRVHALSCSGRAFRVLAELGTEPAVYYLARARRKD